MLRWFVKSNFPEAALTIYHQTGVEQNRSAEIELTYWYQLNLSDSHDYKMKPQTLFVYHNGKSSSNWLRSFSLKNPFLR